MTPEEKSVLLETHRLASENNLILLSLRRSNRVSAVIKAIYWIIIIGVSIGAFYFLQPFMEQAVNTLDQAQQSLKQVGSTINDVKSNPAWPTK